MDRPYFPHPGHLPSEEESRKRWTRPAPIPGRVIGEMPYASYVRRAREGSAPFDRSVDTVPGETHDELVLRLMEAGQLQRKAAHTVALGLEGYDFLKEGRKTVHTAEVLLHRDTARFHGDPTALRGKLHECTSREKFNTICPTVAANLSALRSLKWSRGLRPKDLLLLWILIGCTSSLRQPGPSIGQLKKGFGISRPHDSLQRISQATYSLSGDPDVPPKRWVHDAPVWVDGWISQQLIDYIKPRAGGENYAHVELVALSRLTAVWQEKALRGLMSSAVRARVYWWKGGSFSWHLTLSEAMELFSLQDCSDLSRLRKERVLPLARIMQDIREEAWEEFRKNLGAGQHPPTMVTGSRFTFACRTIREAHAQGRPVNGIALDVMVSPANEHEGPAGRYAIERSNDRAKHQLGGPVVVIGLDKALTADEKRAKRSAAAESGWRRKRANREVPATDVVPSCSGWEEGIEAFLNQLVRDDNDERTYEVGNSLEEPARRPAQTVSPEAAYGYDDVDAGYIQDWDDLVEKYMDSEGTD